MPLSFKPFTQIDLKDIKRLQESAVPEGLRIDYKRDNYAASDGREFLKDISSFANSYGGFLLIGIDEENGLISSIPGIASQNVDDEIQRLENWARDGIEPRIIGIQMRRIEVPGDRAVIALAIPKSLNPPHRVSSQNTNRFFVRNSSGKHEADVEELRHLFGATARLADSIRGFVADRRRKIITDKDVVADLGEGRLIVHVINASTFGDDSFVDIQKLYNNCYGFAGREPSDITRRIMLEGVLLGSEAQGKFYDRTLVYRDATIETVYSHISWENNGRVIVPGSDLIENLLHTIKKSLDGITSLSGSGPFSIWVALDVTREMPIAFYNNGLRLPAFDRDLVELPPLTITEYDPSVPTPNTARPLLDHLWNSVGLPSCGYFQGDKWAPRS